MHFGAVLLPIRRVRKTTTVLREPSAIPRPVNVSANAKPIAIARMENPVKSTVDAVVATLPNAHPRPEKAVWATRSIGLIAVVIRVKNSKSAASKVVPTALVTPEILAVTASVSPVQRIA